MILFGSLARGDVGKRSDLDLIVVLDAPARFLDRLALGVVVLIAYLLWLAAY